MINDNVYVKNKIDLSNLCNNVPGNGFKKGKVDDIESSEIRTAELTNISGLAWCNILTLSVSIK